MNPMMPGMPGDEGTNLLSILITIAFGFVAGLMVFIGIHQVLVYGSSLAAQLLKLSGYGQQMAAFGFASTAAPYVILVPIGGMAVKQLSSVRSLKGFAIFAGTMLAGFAIAYVTIGYFLTVMH